jgi:hypothetical protein
MANKETRRQHYVPRTYLKHFATERNGEYFIKALPISDFNIDKIQEINISNVCLQKDIYTLPGNTPEERMLLETFYSDNYEAHYDQIYQVLIDPDKLTLTDNERELVISTVVTMFYRTTKWISMHNEVMNRALERMFILCQQTGKDQFLFENQIISIAGKTLEQVQLENKIEGRPAQVMTQLDTAMRLIRFRCHNDGIYISKLVDEDCEFVTSDNPVIFSNIFSNRPVPFDPDNVLTVPLDTKHKLFLMPYGDKELKHILARHNVSGSMCFMEKLTSNFEQSKNAERFMLGKESALQSYLQTKDVSERPLTDEEYAKTKFADEILEKGKELIRSLNPERLK